MTRWISLTAIAGFALVASGCRSLDLSASELGVLQAQALDDLEEKLALAENAEAAYPSVAPFVSLEAARELLNSNPPPAFRIALERTFNEKIQKRVQRSLESQLEDRTRFGVTRDGMNVFEDRLTKEGVPYPSALTNPNYSGPVGRAVGDTGVLIGTVLRSNARAHRGKDEIKVWMDVELWDFRSKKIIARGESTVVSLGDAPKERPQRVAPLPGFEAGDGADERREIQEKF